MVYVVSGDEPTNDYVDASIEIEMNRILNIGYYVDLSITDFHGLIN